MRQTARRMTKGVVAILQDFIGSSRRPYLVVEVPGATAANGELGARGAAIQGLQPFASEVHYCLRANGGGEPVLEREWLVQFARAHAHASVLVYGFTYMLWNHLVKPLMAESVCLGLPNVHILHSGGWKRLQHQSVDKQVFNAGPGAGVRLLGRAGDRLLRHGRERRRDLSRLRRGQQTCARIWRSHRPQSADARTGRRRARRGLLQVCSVLPTSFPGHLLLTEDLAEVIALDGCPCGRRGIAFRFAGRAPKAEVRGCGNIQTERQPMDDAGGT